MASWATKRKALYFFLFFAVLLFLIAIPGFLLLYEKPSCFDAKLNQGERGVDCGGPCAKLCKIDALAPSILWARVLKVSPGVYNTVVLIENPNLGLGAVDVSYLLKIYDPSNLLIYERKGKTSIPPGVIFPVFEGTITTAKRVASRATFEFVEQPSWRPYSEKRPEIRVSETKLDGRDGQSFPKLSAVIENRSSRPIPSFGVVAILTGISGNVVAASRTVVDVLPAESKAPAVFTWREPFVEDVVRVEIMPELFPTIHY